MKRSSRTFQRRNKKSKFMKYGIMIFLVALILGTSFFIGKKFDSISASDSKKQVTTEKQQEKKVLAEKVQAEKEAEKKKEQEQKIKAAKPEQKTVEEKPVAQTEKEPAGEKKANSVAPQAKGKEEKVVYLTFDDGPTTNITPQILEVLQKYQVKGTFFVIGQLAEQHPEILKRTKAEGHYVANHTYSHNYKYIYADTTNFLKDIKKGEQVIQSILGPVPSNVIRFPGGSFGRTAFQKAANEAGYHYVDWNSLNGDAEALNVPATKQIARVKESAGEQARVVLLMHDAATKQTTVQALPAIIEHFKTRGYEFRTLDQAFN